MKLTLLDMTQDILSALDSDDVNSIGDTVESMQVARIIRNKYFDILRRSELPDHKQIVGLDPSGNGLQPTLMYVPASIAKIDWIKYYDANTSNSTSDETFEHDLNLDVTSDGSGSGATPPGYLDVNILPIKEFFDHVQAFNSADENVYSFSFADPYGPQGSTEYFRSIVTYCKTDQRPQFCTLLSNKVVLFDSYDSSVDTTLQDSKVFCYGQTIPSFSLTDNFTPYLNDLQFALLLNEAKSLAFYELKQMPHSKADQEIKRQWVTSQRDKSVADKPTSFERFENFGRYPRIGSHGYSKWRK